MPHYSNAAILVQNMALAATDLGVGACHPCGVVGVLSGNDELIKELDLPEGMQPCCVIVLGHIDEKYTLREVADGRIKTSYLK